MADLKGNAVRMVEERMEEVSDAAIRSVREAAHAILSDVYMVAAAKATMPATCDDLVAKAALALVKDADLDELRANYQITVNAGSRTVEMRAGSHGAFDKMLPVGRYRLLLLALPLAGKE